ncbi:MAG TPA: RDD family protein [Vicinamibacteria bacterium]|jgi:uncharacterized RDD family membrane protein YckC
MSAEPTAWTAAEPRADVRIVITPEGVPLSFELADTGDRAGAFLLDCVMIVGAAFVLLLVLVPLVGIGRELGLAIGFLAFFLLRNFYFTWFESRGQGASPGKRRLGLRVVDARGGPLTVEAVFARNLMRELEIFGPLVVLTAPASIWPGAPVWAPPLAGVWVLVVGLMPFFNRDRLRVGDLVAGTMVVRLPRARLRPDLSDETPAAGRFRFTDAQLDVYGTYELQVLEEVLRRSGAPGDRARREVARKIGERISWTGTMREVDVEPFLSAFYTAQRARLEQKMLLGRRQARKRPRSSPTRRP